MNRYQVYDQRHRRCGEIHEYGMQINYATGRSGSRTVEVWLQPLELEWMNAAAKAHGQSLSEWMKSSVLDAIGCVMTESRKPD